MNLTNRIIQSGGRFLAVKVSTTREINKAISSQIKRSKTVKIKGLNGQNYIAVGLSIDKPLSFEGNVGDFFGALNNGTIVNLSGNARRFLGDTMTNGGIIVQGNVQRGAGIAISGGIIVIRGNVTGDIGQLARGGTMIVSGNTGPRTGAFMFNGDIIVAGNVGKDVGQSMVGGVIYVGGKIGTLGENSQIFDISETDIIKLRKYFKHYGILKDPVEFKKILPLQKNPIKASLIEPFNDLKTITQGSRTVTDQITRRTRAGLLFSADANYHDDGSRSIFDHLAILPVQIKPNKNINMLELDLDTKVTIGRSLIAPLVLETPFYLSSRGAGFISRASKMAFIYSAAKLKTALDSGYACYPDEREFSLKYGGKLIHQWNFGRLGMNIEAITSCAGIEIVMGNCYSGSLLPEIPSLKITPELRKLWKLPGGVDFFLPPYMLDFDVAADLKRHVELLKEVTEQKIPVLIKLAAGDVYEDTKLSVRAGADAVVIDCYDECNTSTLDITANNFGLVSLAAISPAVKALKDTRADKRGVKLLVSGTFRNGADIFKALALGANAVALGKTAEIAIGCTQCGNCNSNSCMAGIGTTDTEHETKFDWVDAGKKLTNFLNTLNKELKLLMVLTGCKTLADISKDCLRALDYDMAAITGTRLAGYDKTLPMWEH